MPEGVRTKRPRRKPVDPATAAKARRIEDEVRAWYRRGQQALALSSEDAKDIGQALEKLGAEIGTNPATMRHARQFARVYTEKQLDALLKLRTPDGLPLGWSHVQELIAVADRAERLRLQRLTAREGWTVRRLKAEVQRLHGGKRSQGGRRFAPPGTPEAALRRLADQGRAWLNLHKEIVLLDSHRVLEGLDDMGSAEHPGIEAPLGEALRVLAEVQITAKMVEAQLRKLGRRVEATRSSGDRPGRSNG